MHWAELLNFLKGILFTKLIWRHYHLSFLEFERISKWSESNIDRTATHVYIFPAKNQAVRSNKLPPPVFWMCAIPVIPGTAASRAAVVACKNPWRTNARTDCLARRSTLIPPLTSRITCVSHLGLTENKVPQKSTGFLKMMGYYGILGIPRKSSGFLEIQSST